MTEIVFMHRYSKLQRMVLLQHIESIFVCICVLFVIIIIKMVQRTFYIIYTDLPIYIFKSNQFLYFQVR